MPKQGGEPPFTENEKLFRRLVEDWIKADGSVDEGAIDVPKCSVDRALFASVEDALSRCTESEIAVASVPVGSLPAVFIPEVDHVGKAPPKPYETVVVYDPTVENKAHSHIEFRREGDSEAKKPRQP